MIRSLRGITPKIADTAWVSEFAYVVGNVVIGEHSSVWPGVTIRGDGDLITVGNNVNIQEGSVVHGDGLVIEDYVSIGHCVVVHGDRIGDGQFAGQQLHLPHRIYDWSRVPHRVQCRSAVRCSRAGPEFCDRCSRVDQTAG